jgi:DNA-binding SARP family transcriptional activator
MRSKFLVPTLNRWVVPRSRVRRRLQELCERHQVVWVVGTAGSGKTTAVVDLVSHSPEPTAWLTLDDADVAPGRLLTHIEAAVAATVPGFGKPATDALRTGVPHAEAASLLAAALDTRSCMIVLDEVEAISESRGAVEALSVLVRALPATAQVVLVSRRSVTLRLGSRVGVGGVGRLEEDELALAVDEATELLRTIDHVADIDPEHAVHATGGWITGVLFEAWRSPEHPHGIGGEADALSGYLAVEIMTDLSPAQQWFLTATSVLEEVTADAAERLGVTDARETLISFRGRFLPLWTSDDGTELRCHPRFRQFLRSKLDEAGEPAVELHRRHALLLLDTDRPADAVASALIARDQPLVCHAVECAIPDALARGDVAQVARWLERVAPEAVDRSITMTRAQLVVAVDREAWFQGAQIADRLLALLEETGASSSLEPGLAGTISACLSHVGRQADAIKVLEKARPGPITDAWLSGIGLDAEGTPYHYKDRAPDCGEVVDGMLHRFDLMHGRLSRLVDNVPAPWNASRSSRIAALRAVGRLREAEDLLADWGDSQRSPALNRIRVELLLDLGHSEEATAVLEATGDVARRSSRYCDHLHLLLTASVALRHRKDVGRARKALAMVDSDPTALQHRRVVEQLPLWKGLADLLGHRYDDARDHLTQSLDYMLRWDRQLWVPFAAVYLAEAAWHVGEEDLVDRATAAALAAAEIQGSDHLLLQALREFPLVLSRQLDADNVAGGWRRLGRGLLQPRRNRRQQTWVDLSYPIVRIRDLDDRGIEVDSRPVDPKLSRSVELLAFLALPEHREGVPRELVLHQVFDGRTDERAQAYLRRAIGGLRTVLGPDCIEVLRGNVRCTAPALFSDYLEFQDLAAEAQLVRGAGRLAALDNALALSGTDYLPGCSAEWAAETRVELQLRREELRCESAEAAYDLGDLLDADQRVRGLLRDSPYRESAWRLAMRIAGDLGHDDRVLQLYGTCRDRLADLQAEPARSTVQLVERLRR